MPSGSKNQRNAVGRLAGLLYAHVETALFQGISETRRLFSVLGSQQGAWVFRKEVDRGRTCDLDIKQWSGSGKVVQKNLEKEPCPAGVPGQLVELSHCTCA